MRYDSVEIFQKVNAYHLFYNDNNDIFHLDRNHQKVHLFLTLLICLNKPIAKPFFANNILNEE